MGEIECIRKLHMVKGWSIRRIARELDCSRATVRKAIRVGAPFRYRLSTPRRRPVKEQIEEVVRRLLIEERELGTGRKQRLTAARIEQILREQHGYAGSASTVRSLVRELRQELGDKLEQAFVPLRYEPGEDAQVDFFEAEVITPWGKRRWSFLLVRACYSRRPFIYVAPGATQQALFEGLSQAFEHFGGTFRKLWFDNLTPVVRKVLRGRERELQERFLAFKAHYAFEAEFCAPAKGNEKGGVENGVRYAQRRALAPMPRVSDRAELQEALRQWMAREDERRHGELGCSIGEAWEREGPRLLALPPARFDASVVLTRRVDKYGLVHDGANRYSVPVRHTRGEVLVKRAVETIEVYAQGKRVARHKRLDGRGGVAFELDHYLELLERKARAFDRAAPVRAERASWPRSYEELLRCLRRLDGPADGTRAFVRVLKLHRTHARDTVDAAIGDALRGEQPSEAAVRVALERREHQATPVEALRPEVVERLAHAHVDAPQIEIYDSLIGAQRAAS